MTHIIAYLHLAVALAFAVAPAITTPFSGFEADQLPIPQLDPPIQPSGYTFAIWGLIYVWLVVSALFGAFKRRDDAAWDRARRPLIVSLAIGVPWLWIANQSAIWANITIALMAIFAIWSLLLSPKRDRWTFRVPAAIYAGWLTAATWVSVGSTAAGYGVAFDGFGWAFAGISGALMCALVVIWRSRNTAYALTLVWALAGIVAANLGSNTASVAYFAIAGAAIIGGTAWQRRTTF